MKNLLFIPCYNDNQNCKKILNEIIRNNKNFFDILIINDGSDKKFNYLSDKFKITILNLGNNYGIGFGMKLAINYALKNKYNKICRIDSDGEHNPKYIKNFFFHLNKYNFVIGIRKIHYRENLLKLFSKKFIISIINLVFKLDFNDYNCGMMSMNINSMKAIKKEYFINYPEPQIILKLCQKKMTYFKLKIIQRKRSEGTSSLNLFGGLDFFLVTLTFILNRVLNKND